jgi:hypothetical protein
MSNVAGKAYGMNVITPMTPAATWVNRLLFMASRAIPSTLQGLLGLSLIHFARWVIIRRDQWPTRGKATRQTVANDYMLFCSNFNGGPVHRRVLRRHPERPRPVLVFEPKISAIDPCDAVQELHPLQPDRHQLLLQPPPARLNAISRRRCAYMWLCAISPPCTPGQMPKSFPQRIARH